MGLDGQEEVLPLAPRVILAPRWAPDGQRIAFAGGEPGAVRAGGVFSSPAGIYTYDVQLRTEPRPVAVDGQNANPVWAPDGSSIVFRRDQDLAVKTLDDDAPPAMVLVQSGQDIPTNWSADGTVVFVNRSSATDADMWTMADLDSTATQPYMPSEGLTYRSSGSPEGDLLAYESNESGRDQVYVQSFPTPRQATPVSVGRGGRPRWAPDGRTLYYWADAPAGDTLIAASVQREPTFPVLRREVVLVGDYNFDDWDLHPDGNRFIMARPVESAGPVEGSIGERHLIVTNWFTELRAAVGEVSR